LFLSSGVLHSLVVLLLVDIGWFISGQPNLLLSLTATIGLTATTAGFFFQVGVFTVLCCFCFFFGRPSLCYLLLTVTASVSGVENNNAVVDVTDFYFVKTVNNIEHPVLTINFQF
jgi:hypothetical protein